MSATELAALEAIFSCGICFTSYSDIYRREDRVVDTLSDPDLLLPGTVPKLWMTSCGHVICGRDLEGGGAPFHPVGVDMVTKCAICVRDFAKTKDVTLYPIWGVMDGFYDSRLPKAFFKVPPIKFEKVYIQNTGAFGQGRGPSEQEREATIHAREALRFQFISLICYAKGIRAKLSEAERERDEFRRQSEHQINASREENAMLLTSLHVLDDQRERYKDKLVLLEKEKAAWQQKKRIAVHYLGLVEALAEENMMLKQQLASLGHSVKETSYAFDRAEMGILSSDHSGSEAAVGLHMHEIDATVLKDKSKKIEEPGVDNAQQVHGIRPLSDIKKRKYLSSRGEVSNKARSIEDLRSIRRQRSRDEMPPPSLPLGRGHAKTITNSPLFTSSRHTEDDSSSLDPFLVSVPIVNSREIPIDRDITMLDRQSGKNWPFAGPNQIDATRGQTAASAYFPKARTSHVFRLESMEWVKTDLESPKPTAQHDTAHTTSTDMSGAGVLLQSCPTQITTRSQNGHRSSAPLTEASLAALREQLRPTLLHGHRQTLPSMSRAMPLLDRGYSDLTKNRSTPTDSAADKVVFHPPAWGTHRNSVESVRDRPLLERGSSYNGESCRVSNTAPIEPPIAERGPTYNVSKKACSIPGKAASINGDAVEHIRISSRASHRRPLNNPSTASFWLRSLSNIASSPSNPTTKRAATQENASRQSIAPDWYASQARSHSANPLISQGQLRLPMGSARDFMSKSSNWIKRSAQGLRNLACRSPSVSSPFFRREDMGASRRPSPTMEESESYEVYQRFRTGDRSRVSSRHTSTRNGLDRGSSSATRLRSAAIRDHISGGATREETSSNPLPFRYPFSSTCASQDITVVETSFGGSRMMPSSGRRIVRH
ncbi:hypothetical protein GP486_004531 [Trichoglossum hirsutum]|uniref:Uncharacterized protein n=1 Tax=Trichoglossum hirsutum TaxID=265104 RepID=A0A9P8RNY6_9PEZI|nr:hypothetical protein GP486_004531 [Trichoglossum hirsutum]